MTSSAHEVHSRRILGYEISPKQDAVFNYLLSSIVSSSLYIILIACDISVIFRHYKDENPIWASLTVFFMYLPVLGCYLVIVSSWEMWPKPEGYGLENIQWFLLKTAQHFLFPIWTMWRYAERIFWSIEAVRAEDENSMEFALSACTAPRSVELYLFLQGYLHVLPQMLLQLNTLMRRASDFEKQTADVQIASVFFCLSKMAATTAFYQRFKTQKLAGKQYLWFKSNNQNYSDSVDALVKLRSKAVKKISVNQQIDTPVTEHTYNAQPPMVSLRRSSSEFYMKPSSSFTEAKEQQWPQVHANSVYTRETSILDGPLRRLFRQTEVSEPDFNIRRLINVKGMPEDDIAGKLISFCWWFCFLLARILAISTFAFFYTTHTIWLLAAHFIIIEAFLLYDCKSDEVKRAKAMFFLFIGFIYIFCIIEFKIKFKKTKFIYYGFFTLVYLENFVMCLVWWFSDVADLENDFWFRYVLYLIVMCSVISLFAMLFYLNVNKPKKIVIGTEVL